MLCKSRVKAIVIVKWRAMIGLMLVDDVDLTQITRKNSRWFESHNCSSREIIMHDKSSTRTCRRDALDAFCIARWRGVESSPASGRIFGIDSFSTIFVPFFRAVVHALEGGNCGEKLLFARTIIIAACFCEGEEVNERELRTCSLTRPPGRKNDVCTDTRITSDFPGRVTTSLLGTSVWTPIRRLVSALFSRYSDLILHARCE